jgi:hypothetical protein
LLTAGTLCIGAGCTSSFNPNSEIDDLINTFKESTLLIRVVNQTGSTVQLTFDIDGSAKTLSNCSASEVCDYLLQTCPGRIALLEERRFNQDGGFAGSRFFGDNQAFTFETGEFTCGATIIYELSNTGASASAQ